MNFIFNVFKKIFKVKIINLVKSQNENYLFQIFQISFCLR